MSVPGVDYAWTKPTIAALKTAGEVFVVQYLSDDPTKNLTKARADALLAAGIAVCANWEFAADAPRHGKAQGQRDAATAQRELEAIGLPHIPVWFSCDYDAPPGDQAAINGYYDGCAAELGDDRGRNGYGGFWPMSRAYDAGRIRRVWGTVAWSGSNWATWNHVPDIMQGPFVKIGGVTCDLDAAHSTDFGQWPRPVGPVKTWQTLTADGTQPLAQIAATVGMSASRVLRITANHRWPWGQKYDPVTAAWLNDVFADTVAVTDPVPAGAKLRVLA